MEGLEPRMLLAADVAAWHNPVLAEDVNADAFVSLSDALLVISELRTTGARSLAAEPSGTVVSAATLATPENGEPEGEQAPLYLDVNGDNYLSSADALMVVSRLVAEGQADLVSMRFEITDSAGTVVDSVGTGEEFSLNVYVEDLRPESVQDRGVYSAFLNILYDSPFVSIADAVTFGSEYNALADQSIKSTPGLIEGVGNAQTDFGFGGSVGPGEFLLLTVPFSADAAPLFGVADDSGTDATLNVSEDSQGVLIDVLANDTAGGTASFQGMPAQNPPLTDTLLYNLPDAPVAASDIIFGSDSVEIVSTGSFSITDVGATTAGGSAVSASGGTRVAYLPGASAQALGVGETGTDSFTYTFTDGFGTSSATVTVTIVGQNDAPVALDADSFATTEAASIGGSLIAFASDVDTNDALTFSGSTTSALGAVVSVKADGTFTYNPTGSAALNARPANSTIQDTFSYAVADQHGASATGTVTVTVTGLNDPPVTVADQGEGFTTDEDTGFTTANVLANDTDVDGDTLSIIGVNTNGTQGAVIDNGDGTFTYTPNALMNTLHTGENVNDSFVYTVSDGNGGTHSTSVTITVLGVNDLPEARDDSGTGFTTDQNTPLVTPNVLDNDTDAESDSLSVTAIDTSGTFGQVTDRGDGTFQYDPNGQFDYLAAGESATDSFVYTVDDGHGGEDTATVTITVTGLNDPPAPLDAIGTTDEDTPLDGELAELTFDPDVTDTLEFSGDTVGSLGSAITIDPDGTVLYDPRGVSAIQALVPGETLQETFTYTVSDGTVSETALVTITVSGVDDPPVAADDQLFVDEATTDNVLDVLANDTDPDAGALLVIDSVGATDQGGVVSVAGDGLSILYTPATGFVGSETFTYTIRDETGLTATATVVVDVEPAVKPRARADAFTVAEDSQDVALDVFANDQINDGGTPTIALSQGPDQGGTVVITGPTTLQYTPAANFFGTETFRYTLSDEVGDPQEAVVTVTVSSVNDFPEATPDFFGTDEDTAITTGNVLLNDVDIEGDTLSIIDIDTTLTVGTVTNHGDGTFSYDPAGQFDALGVGDTATDTFTYTVGDGNGGEHTATVTITVTGVNDAPVAQDDSASGYSTTEDAAITTANVLDNDSDAEGDTLTLLGIDTTGTVGQVTDMGDGTFSYDPNGQFEALAPGQTATDSFTYTISDGNGGEDTATVTITIAGVNDPPVANDDSGVGFATDEDTPLTTASVFGNDTDVDQGMLAVTSVDTTGMLGQLTDNGDGTFTYDPGEAFQNLGAGDTETETFTYALSDGQGGSDTAVVTITIGGVNDAPVAGNDSGAAFTTDQNSAFGTGNVLDNDTDVENDTLAVVAIDTTGTIGLVTDNGDGTFSYDPNGQFLFLGAGQTANDYFAYAVGDGNEGTGVATVTITVTGLNDGPMALDATFDGDEDTLLNRSLGTAAADPDVNDSIVFSGDTTSAYGASVSVGSGGTFSYDPTGSSQLQALLPGETVADTFSYTVTDESGLTATATVTINVSGVNDPPTAGDDVFTGIIEDSANHLLDVLANDVTTPESGETLTIAAIGVTSAGGEVVIDGSQLRYTPAADFFGTETFTYTVTDGHGGSSTAIVSVGVTGTNDPPTAGNDFYDFISGTGPYTLDVFGNDTIAPDTGETLSIVSVDTPSQGGTVVNQGTSLLYTPPAGIHGVITETFSYTVDDGTGETSTATVTVEVAGYLPSTLSGSVFVDANRDGLRGDTEWGLGDVEVALAGVDMFGDGVSLVATTSRDGSYSFGNVKPGTYTIVSAQGAFLVDGLDQIGSQGGGIGNDQLSVSIGQLGGVTGENNNFCEAGLQPQYLSIWDFLNTSSREGIVFATDSQAGQQWYSFLDGWDDFASATASVSADGSLLTVTLVDQASQTTTLSLALAECASLHIRGHVGNQWLVQLLGPATDYVLAAEADDPTSVWQPFAEGEGLSDSSDMGGWVSAATLAVDGPESIVPVSSVSEQADLGLLSGDAEGEAIEPFAASTPAASALATTTDSAEGLLWAIDAAFANAEREDAWEPILDGLFD